MPRSDDQHDYLHTFTVEGEGKSKSTRIAPLEVGRNDAPTRLLALDEIGSSSVRTPPTGTRLLHYDDNGVLVSETGSGTTEEVRGADELVTLTGSPVPVGAGTSLEIEQGQSIVDDTGTDRITVGASDVAISTADVGSFSTQPTFSSGLAVPTGQRIVDTGGGARVSINNTRTVLADDANQPAYEASAGFFNTISARSNTPARIFDREGLFTALSYSTSTSAPGTLSLNNAALDASGSVDFILGGTIKGNITTAASGGGSGDSLILQSLSGEGPLQLGVAQTGSAEVEIFENDRTQFSIGGSEKVRIDGSGLRIEKAGSGANDDLRLGKNGARLFVDSNGDVVAEDEDGSTVVLT